MGEVYRARDRELNRYVAIKVLPEAFAVNAERLARFTREAQTLAVLNHPNIPQIYGLEGDASGPHLELWVRRFDVTASGGRAHGRCDAPEGRGAAWSPSFRERNSR